MRARGYSRFFCTALALVSWLFPGCVSARPYVRLDETVARGNYEAGLSLIDAGGDSLYRPRDAILFYLDKGLLAHYAGRYGDSSALLQDGERAIEAAYTKSITLEIGSYLLNDNTREYEGEDYEDIYINVFNALNYYHRGSLEDALVEIRRMNNKLQFLASKYGIIMSSLQQKALEEARDLPLNRDADASPFNDSALARYLGLLFYRGTGRLDDARIDRDYLKTAFANAPQVYPHPVPASVDRELEIPRGQARLNVLAFSGLSPVKEEAVIRIPLPRRRYLKIALPVMEPRPSLVRRIEVQIDGAEGFNHGFSEGFSLELLENIEAVARETFRQKEELIYLKTIIRASMKGITSSVLSAASEEAEGQAGTMLWLLSLGTQVLAEATEQADLRISRYFPARAYVGGINLSPGTYDVRVNYYGANNRLIASSINDAVEVRENTLNLVEAVCLR
jgi:hypothetical protein